MLRGLGVVGGGQVTTAVVGVVTVGALVVGVAVVVVVGSVGAKVESERSVLFVSSLLHMYMHKHKANMRTTTV